MLSIQVSMVSGRTDRLSDGLDTVTSHSLGILAHPNVHGNGLGGTDTPDLLQLT